MSAKQLPCILVTGASGFIGRNFLEAVKNDFRIHALARRPQQEVGIPLHSNIKWYLVDIADRNHLTKIFNEIRESGCVDYVFHLAGYYDFGNGPSPEYERTNVNGTRNVLELTRSLAIKRFIFASSIAACNFPVPGTALTEDSPLDADYPYAWSKREGEKMIGEFSTHFPCSIIRFAAVFSDWCEYGVLYMFMNAWCSGRWNARILGGSGESAIPFIHIRDLVKLVTIIIDNTAVLPGYDIYLASPNGCIPHRQLFELSTRYYFGQSRKPIDMPKWLALIGVYGRDLLGRLIG
ncbi:MAG: NAD(P)-dependent oxidoreductase, partial [Candidatus Neomarinimicrobiota bacterium]